MKEKIMTFLITAMLVFGTNQKGCQATATTATNTGNGNISVYAGGNRNSTLQTVLSPGQSVWLSKSYPVVFGVSEDGSLACYYGK